MLVLPSLSSFVLLSDVDYYLPDVACCYLCTFLEAFSRSLLDSGLALAELWKLTFSVEYFVACPTDGSSPLQLEHAARQMPH